MHTHMRAYTYRRSFINIYKMILLEFWHFHSTHTHVRGPIESFKCIVAVIHTILVSKYSIHNKKKVQKSCRIDDELLHHREPCRSYWKIAERWPRVWPKQHSISIASEYVRSVVYVTKRWQMIVEWRLTRNSAKVIDLMRAKTNVRRKYTI